MPTAESHRRSIAKAVSWRTTGTLDTFILSYLVTGNLIFAGSIAGVETVTKIVLYYFHERIWSAISWGREPRAALAAGRGWGMDGLRLKAAAAVQGLTACWTRRRYEAAGAAAVLAILAVVATPPLRSPRPPQVAASDARPRAGSPLAAAVLTNAEPMLPGVQAAERDLQTHLADPDPSAIAALAEPEPPFAEQASAVVTGAPDLDEEAPAPVQQHRDGAPTRSLANSDQVKAVQQRLAELGYFHASATGVWGSQSRQALAAFKAQAQLPADDVWDEAAERSLFSGDVQGSTSFVGHWAPNTRACTPQLNRDGLLPATINDQGAWAGETACMFRRKQQNGNVWTMAATCSNDRSRWAANVRLEVRGDRLTWSSERGSQTYVRCRQGQLFAQAAH